MSAASQTHKRLALLAATVLAALWLTQPLASAAPAPPMPPVIVIPGFVGSDMDVMINTTTPPLGCPPYLPWTAFWPPDNMWFSNATMTECLIVISQVGYDSKAKTYTFAQGTQFRIKDFGGTSGFFWGQFDFFDKLWTEGYNYFGAPYDFRLTPDGLGEFYERLQSLVEYVAMTQQTRVNLFGESNGGMITLGFLNRMSQAWKDEYICSFFANSPVWGGAPYAIDFSIYGQPSRGFNPLVLRDMAIGWPSSLYNFPHYDENYGYNSTQTVVHWPGTNYTAKDLDKWLLNISNPAAAALLDVVQDEHNNPFSAPGVDTYIVYGNSSATPNSLYYKSTWSFNVTQIPPSANVANVNGDQLVTVQSSLRGQLAWQAEHAKLKKLLVSRGYSGMNHAECVKSSSQCNTDAMAFYQSLNCSYVPRKSL